MSIVRWDPFQEVAELQRAVNRLFDDRLRHDSAYTQTFPVGIYETADEVVVQAELPGVSKEDVNVQVQGSQLTIRARRQHRAPEGATWLRQESTDGEFLRTFNLGLPIRPDGIVAEYENGVLSVHLPKADEVKPRQIAIR